MSDMTPTRAQLHALMLDLTRLDEQRRDGDTSEALFAEIRYAAIRVHVALLKIERARLLAQPELSVEDRCRLYEIQVQLLSPDIDLPENRAAAQEARRWHSRSLGRAVDLPPPLARFLAPPAHVHWRATRQPHDHWALPASTISDGVSGPKI